MYGSFWSVLIAFLAPGAAAFWLFWRCRSTRNAFYREQVMRQRLEAELLSLRGQFESCLGQAENEKRALLDQLTCSQQAEEKMRLNEKRSALHDPLTGLPNRSLFLDRLERAIERARRHPGYCFSIIYLDIDQFKAINDSLGHVIGDLLLIESARRLESCIRAEDTLSRLGGDEFVMLLEDINDLALIKVITARVQQALTQPLLLQDHQVFTSASMGIVNGCECYQHPQDILRDADIAMYRAKLNGRARAETFEPEMLERAVARLDMEIELRAALEHSQFMLYYQPILKLDGMEILWFEALLRWKHPQRGIVPPADFIPLAEETGLIIPIGKWVIYEACRQLKAWQKEFPKTPPLKMAVNLSPRQFTQPGFDELLARLLPELGIDPADLLLEITENILMENHHTKETLENIRSMGIKIQIDDFGTGYSSLSYLHQFPVDALKIDRSFVNQMNTNASEIQEKKGPEIVRTIIHLAQVLDMRVVVEGVETEAQMTQLKALGCTLAQGHLFYRAMGSQSIHELLLKLNPRGGELAATSTPESG